MRTRTTAALLSLLLSPLAAAQEAPAAVAPAPVANPWIDADTWQKIVAEGKGESSKVMQWLDHLTNRIGPRLTSSDNLTNACEWARDTFKGFGLDNARLEEWGTFPVGFNRGPWSGEITAPESARQALVFCTNAWSAGTRGRQEGRIVKAPKNKQQAEERAQELAGAWLYQSGGGGPAEMFGPATSPLDETLASLGALGTIVGSRGDLLVTSGNHRVNFAKLPKLPRIILRRDHFQAIGKLLEDGGEVRAAFDVRNHFEKGPIPLHNVLADLVGSQAPEEYVVVGGHIDSWDGATGTTDNGTGTATTIEAARILTAAGVKPKRTIRFMLWSGEEQGLLGSVAWCRQNRELVKNQVSACYVHDMGTNYVAGVQGFQHQMDALRSIFQGFAGIDAEFPFSVSQSNFVMPGSDHYAFHQVGAPGFFWLQKGKAVYNHTHHTQHDTYEAAIAPYQKQSATVIALAALATANYETLLPRPGKDAGLGNMTPSIDMIGLKLEGDSMVVKSIEKEGMGMQMGLKVEPGDKLLTFEGKKLVGGEQGLMRTFFGWAMSGATKGKLVVERQGQPMELVLQNPMSAGGAGGSEPAKQPATPARKGVRP